MFQIFAGEQRGRADHGWLKSHHTFSFADYYDASRMGFGTLRVINEDRVAPGAGFGTHPHRDMEIISYVIEGALEHRDSMGNGSVIRPGEIQHMRAGTGVTHSEFNHSHTESVHLLQIWILPERRGLEPRYAQRSIDEARREGAWLLLASPSGKDGTLSLGTDVEVLTARLSPSLQLSYAVRPGRATWMQVVRGRVAIAGTQLQAGDAIAVEGEPRLELEGLERAELLLFDLGGPTARPG